MPDKLEPWTKAGAQAPAWRFGIFEVHAIESRPRPASSQSCTIRHFGTEQRATGIYAAELQRCIRWLAITFQVVQQADILAKGEHTNLDAFLDVSSIGKSFLQPAPEMEL